MCKYWEVPAFFRVEYEVKSLDKYQRDTILQKTYEILISKFGYRWLFNLIFF